MKNTSAQESIITAFKGQEKQLKESKIAL